jgi:hypothetical protein
MELRIKLKDKAYFFGELGLFNTRSFWAAGRRFNKFNNLLTYGVGLDYNFLALGKSNFYFVSSYYNTLSSAGELYFTDVNYLYERANVKLIYGYAPNILLIGISYEKLFNGYRDSLGFNVEKSLVKNSYLDSYISYEYSHDIKTRDDYFFVYDNIIYRILSMDNLFDTKHSLHYKIKISFPDSQDILLSVGRIWSSLYGEYYSYEIGFGFGY